MPIKQRSGKMPISVSTEIWETIVKLVILAPPRTDDTSTISPQNSLAPLLVSKLWCQLAEKYLYRSISVGWPRQPAHPSTERLADRLLATLSTNSRLAELVRTLNLLFGSCNQELMVHILQLCPNIEHVQIRGCDPSKLDPLIAVLKGKSLLSLSIYPQDHSLMFPMRPRPLPLPVHGANSSQLFGMLQKWPKLRSIKAGAFLASTETVGRLAYDANGCSNCCPELRTIVLTGNRSTLDENDLKTLRVMCPSIKEFSVPLRKTGTLALDELCKCLHSWSLTLERLTLEIPGYNAPYWPFSHALSHLTQLKELSLINAHLDFRYISDLPNLELVRYVSALCNLEQMNAFARFLSDDKKFPSIKRFIHIGRREPNIYQHLRDICSERNILLELQLVG